MLVPEVLCGLCDLFRHHKYKAPFLPVLLSLPLESCVNALDEAVSVAVALLLDEFRVVGGVVCVLALDVLYPGPYAVHGVFENSYADFHVVLEADESHVLRLLAVVAFPVPLAAVALSNGRGERYNPRLPPLAAK